MEKGILINFPTNIGDTILSLPVLDRVKFNYPWDKITAVVSPKTKELIGLHSFIDEIVLFDKSWTKREKRNFAFDLRGKYKVVVDLKNSFLPVVIDSKIRTPFIRFFPKKMHAKDRHISLIKKIAPRKSERKGWFLDSDNKFRKWDGLNIPKSLFIACSSRSKIKQYPYRYLRQLVDSLKGDFSLIVLGEESDRSFYKDILSLEGVKDFVGKTSLPDIFYLLNKYALGLIAVDSSILHIGSYLNIPVVGIFGPTDSVRFGPWSDKNLVLRNEKAVCAPCGKAVCRFNNECMDINPEAVISALGKIISYGKS